MDTAEDFTNSPYFPLDANGLVDGILEGKVAMPDFQRDFVWKPKNVISLLVSAANGWPIGSILVRLKNVGQSSEFRLKEFHRMPAIDEQTVSLIVLDGQQRLTSLVHAFHPEENSVTYFVDDVFRVLAAGDHLTEDDFAYMNTPKFKAKFPDQKSRALAGKATLSDLRTSSGFSRWYAHADPKSTQSDLPDALEALDRKFGSLYRIEIPAIRLDPQMGLEPVAAIFETVNRTGVRLDVDDLMLAKLYPFDFMLHDEWDSVLKRYERIGRFGDSWDSRGKSTRPLSALHILKLIAYATDGGIKRNNVLDLKPLDVKNRWESACQAIEQALQFLAEYCGVVRHNLLPDEAMIYPVAACYFHDVSAASEERLVKWFWQAVVDESYDRNTTTLPVTDANTLVNKEVLPERLAFSEDGPEFLKQDLVQRLLERKNRHDILQRGSASMLIKLGVEDWDGKTLSNPDLDIEFHHVFPQAHSKSAGWKKGREQDPVDITANLTPLFSTTNQKVGLQPPGVYATSDVVRQRIIRHEIPESAFEVDSLQAFRDWARARANVLADRLLGLC